LISLILACRDPLCVQMELGVFEFSVSYLQIITVSLVFVVSAFILVYPSKDKTSDEEHWSKHYNENDDTSNPISKIIVPPGAFVSRKEHGLSTTVWNKLSGIYRAGHNSSDSNDDDSENLVECPGLKGAFRLNDIPTWSTPVLAFVNSKSGGKKGEEVMALLKCYLNPSCQVVDLCRTRPEAVLTPGLLAVPRLILLVCGGDGTVTWVLNAVDSACAACPGAPAPPIAIYPLGTGNDLSHVLGWGASVNLSSEEHGLLGSVEGTVSELLDGQCSDVPHLLMKISSCSDGGGPGSCSCGQAGWACCHAQRRGEACVGSEELLRAPEEDELEEGDAALGLRAGAQPDRASVVVRRAELDRWRIAVTPPIGADSSARLSEFCRRQDCSLVFNNYFSVGVDAQIVYDFHQLRDRSPQHFVSQIGNKLWYGLVGGQQVLRHDCQGLPRFVALFVGDRRVELPADLEGIVFSNIASYAGGTHLWQLDDEEEEDLGAARTTERLLLEGSSAAVASALSTLETVGSEVLRYSASQLDVSDLSSGSAGTADAVVETDTEIEVEVEATPSGPTSPSGRAHSPLETRARWFVPDRMGDGVVEVLGVSGSLHLAQIKSGLALPYKLAQIDCSRRGEEVQIRLVTSRSLPMQMDGEPWLESACDMTITLVPRKAQVLLCEEVEVSECRESLTDAPTDDTYGRRGVGDRDEDSDDSSFGDWGLQSLGSDDGGDDASGFLDHPEEGFYYEDEEEEEAEEE
jgi:hypothetical protein